MFCGSYRPSDVEFLLKPITIDFIADLEFKESLIQSGTRHYSEMLSPRKSPQSAILGCSTTLTSATARSCQGIACVWRNCSMRSTVRN
jgi:hypothetical protein